MLIFLHSMPLGLDRLSRTPAKEAADWYVVMSNHDVSDREARKFQAWLDKDPRNQAAYFEVDALMREVEEAAETSAPSLEQRRHTARDTSRASNPLLGGWQWSVAAVLALVVVGAGVFSTVSHFSRGDALVYATAVGGQKTVTLSDDSTVILNTDSRIRVSFSGSQRRIDLLRGEAAFDVAHDKKRPFRVFTETGRVEALGTEFDVRRRDASMQVTLLEGSVAVTGADAARERRNWFGAAATSDSIVLSPGQRIDVAGNSFSDIEAVDLGKARSWTSGVLEFSNTPLYEVALELERYNPVSIDIRGETLRELSISGAFDAKDLASFAENIAYTLSVDVSSVNDDVIVISRKNPSGN